MRRKVKVDDSENIMRLKLFICYFGMWVAA